MFFNVHELCQIFITAQGMDVRIEDNYCLILFMQVLPRMT